MDKYDNFTLDAIVQEMRKNDIRLSLIAPNKGLKEFERMVTEVNDSKAELHTVTEPISPDYIVQLAGFKLPVPAPAPVMDDKKQVASKRVADSSAAAATSPQSVSSTDSNIKRKRDNVPGQINLPKATVDPAKFAQVHQKHLNAVNAAPTTQQQQPQIKREPNAPPKQQQPNISMEQQHMSATMAQQNMMARPPQKAESVSSSPSVKATPPQQPLQQPTPQPPQQPTPLPPQPTMPPQQQASQSQRQMAPQQRPPPLPQQQQLPQQFQNTPPQQQLTPQQQPQQPQAALLYSSYQDGDINSSD
ncbi:hypothetical protein BDB00DRAFT_640113 [Zychaea mexicana]|uniref:uncharacterized protein n=1 Tax=Zychaea mexicana TaxID=64656 RepID=UPI0022FF313D|nr:uncharacterized protein BDB00DRAFT_640113 [Zychaea mexicana]KAI9489031.1 hypothetical protein BDB00DRAFT_640113 [Zychaea mexicana]